MSASAESYARRLLQNLGLDGAGPFAAAAEHPAVGWAGSGLMALTGEPSGPPQMCPIPLTTCADGALAALARLAPAGVFAGLRGSQFLAERAAIAGYTRNGAVSPGGSCRLLEGADGWIAVNLAREEDWALVSAWLGREIAPEWEALALELRAQRLGDLVERGRMLGLAIGPLQSPLPLAGGREEGCARLARVPPADRSGPTPPADPMPEGERGLHAGPRVLDLSSLWAGPLCSHLLQLAGADVIKLESRQRPDGARSGPPSFFDLLNAGKRSVALDFSSARDRAQLQALVGHADIVIEASRPRALRQLGIHAEDIVRENPRLTWLSITGYGRGEPGENWIAYGDDAAVAAGLSEVLHAATGQRLICGDAIADPLTGLHAALAAWAGYRQGGGGMVSMALTGVVRQCLAFDCPRTPETLRARQREWSALVTRVAAPRARRPAQRARELGADTQAVLAEWGVA